MLGVSAGLVVIATVKNQYNFPTIDDLAEAGQVVAVWYRWVAVVVAVGAVLAAEPVRRRIQIRSDSSAGSSVRPIGGAGLAPCRPVERGRG
jgi:hypothetical protein